MRSKMRQFCRSQNCLLPLVCFVAVVSATHLPVTTDGFAEYRCGDYLCHCTGETANCGQIDTYMPQLPQNIIELIITSSHLTFHTLRSDFFVNVSQITSLSIGNDVQLTAIPNGVFDPMWNLTSLDMRYLKGFSDLQSLKYVLSIPTLKELNFEGCSLGPFPEGVFLGINSTAETLKLTYNKLYPDSFSQLADLQALKELIAGASGVTVISPSRPFPELVILEVGSSGLAEFPETCTHGTILSPSLFPKLEYLDLSGNEIFLIDTSVCLPELKNLILLNTGLSYIKNFVFSVFPKLESLVLKANGGIFTLSPNAFTNRHLQTLRLYDNNIQFQDSFNVDDGAFAGCYSLSYLSLKKNNFAGIDAYRFKKLFGRLVQLTTLELAQCQISEIPKGMFVGFFSYSLETLGLRGNKISHLPSGAFDTLYNLQYLDLSENKISIVKETTFGLAVQNNLQTLLLNGNPFDCSCDILWFQGWFMSNRSRFSPTGAAYTCSNMQALQSFVLNRQACLLDKQTSVLIIWTCCFIILSFSASVLLFRFRWHMRLLLYEAFRGRDDARRRRLLENNFDYDIFVSYASGDLTWVRDRLMPELEGRLGLRLCIHERDFIPGNNIVDNIAECVERSKKVLMVFSKDFLRSQWCQFELNYCLRHVMDYDDALIIVCVDDVTSLEMTTAMMAVLKTTTYIQWDELEDAVDAFWGRIHIGLNEIITAHL